MTATQAPPAANASDSTESALAPPGLAGILGSADHKVVGRLYVGFAFLFGLASAVTGVLAGVDRLDGELGNTVLSGDSVSQVLTFHATSAVILFAIPALIGLALVVVPLQVGARTIAFPRAAAASLWTFVLGGGLNITAFAINGGPGGGEPDGVALWVVSTALVLGALILGAVCVATTILAIRAPGMTLDRVPMFSWSMLCAATLWILSLPVAIAALLILYIDHRNGQVFTGGTGTGMYEQVAWLAQQPQVYALAIPVLGLVLDTAATASGVRLANRAVARVLIGTFAALSFGAFVLPGLVVEDQPVTKAMALLAPLPVLGILGLVGLTLKGGKPKPNSGLIAGALALLVLLLGTLVGAATAFEGALEVAGTQWNTAHTHLVLGATVIALIGGLLHWATKITGSPANEAIAKGAPLLLALGTVVVAVPEAISGLTGEGTEASSGLEVMNGIALAGAGIVILGALAAVAALAPKRRDDSPADPWGGQTLEWSTASPPSFDNFDGDLPVVTSAEPLLADDTDEEAGA